MSGWEMCQFWVVGYVRNVDWDQGPSEWQRVWLVNSNFRKFKLERPFIRLFTETFIYSWSNVSLFIINKYNRKQKMKVTEYLYFIFHQFYNSNQYLKHTSKVSLTKIEIVVEFFRNARSWQCWHQKPAWRIAKINSSKKG